MATRKVWFATNREYKKHRGKDVFGSGFNDEGPHIYRVGVATTTRKRNGLYSLENFKVHSETPPSQSNPEGRPGSAKMFKELRDTLNKNDGAELLIFLHGFDNDFQGPLERAAELSEKYTFELAGKDVPLIPFAFCWPSDAKKTPWRSYYADRADAKASGPAMARSLQRLIGFVKELKPEERCQQPIHLVAHSMGNWALRHFVQTAKEINGSDRLPRIFDQVFLMAADEDYDALEKPEKLGPLADMARAIHVYYSEGDDALDISDITKGNPERLGSVGPKTMDGLSSKIRAIDCAAVDETPRLDADHQYYHLREEVIEDVREVLKGVVPDQIDGREILQPGRRYRLKSKDGSSLGGNAATRLARHQRPHP